MNHPIYKNYHDREKARQVNKMKYVITRVRIISGLSVTEWEKNGEILQYLSWFKNEKKHRPTRKEHTIIDWNSYFPQMVTSCIHM
jgi:hypothetical protein